MSGCHQSGKSMPVDIMASRITRGKNTQIVMARIGWKDDVVMVGQRIQANAQLYLSGQD
jgi:hypothetical protein